MASTNGRAPGDKPSQLDRDKARLLRRRTQIAPYLDRVVAAEDSLVREGLLPKPGARPATVGTTPSGVVNPRVELAALGGYSVNPRHTTYAAGSGQSFFKDVATQAGNGEAKARLRVHAMEQRDQLRQREQVAAAGIRDAGFEVERRAINTSSTSGGEFVPPLTLLDAWAPMARAGRRFADGFTQQVLPAGAGSLTIPRATTGASAAIQTANNAAVSSTDLVTTSITCPVVTVVGAVDTSLQLLEQTAPQFLDSVLIADLLADYSAKLDLQALNGTGSGGQALGFLNVTGLGNVAFTTGSPTLILGWPKVGNARSQVGAARLLPATGIYMHPRRWAWCLSQLDTNNSPMIREDFDDDDDTGDQPQNSGTMLHLPVFETASIPTNFGGGTEDKILVTRLQDAWLWGSQAYVRVMDDPLSGTLGIRVELHRFVALTAARYSGSAAAGCTVSGTGLAGVAY